MVPLDPAEGPCYRELVHDYESDDDLDKIYKVTVRDQDSRRAYRMAPREILHIRFRRGTRALEESTTLSIYATI